MRIVNEPTAASLAYGLHRLRQGVIAVYDLGGGTFDISILRVKDGIFEVLATNGDTHLGGDDFDRVLMLWLLEDIQARHHAELDRDCVDLARDPEAMQELRLAAEAAKIRLSAEERTTLTLPFAGFTYHREITRAERRAAHRAARGQDARARAGRALADAGLTPADIDQVVLVGGSTRVPLVRRRVQELFGKAPHSQLNPDEVVALGAAVQAHILAGGITNMLLLDVTPLSLGIETLGGDRSRPHRAQHDDPDQRARDVHDVGGRPDGGRHARGAGRARAGQGLPLAGALRAARDRSRCRPACRRSR